MINRTRRFHTLKWTAISFGTIGVVLAIAAMIAHVSQSIKEAKRGECVMHMHQISLALWSYQNKYGTLPPAVVTDANGNPAHSWRVLILPFLDSQEIYDRYDFSEPWNGPNNSRLLSECERSGRAFFYCPLSRSLHDSTNYVAVTGPGTLWPTNGAGALSEDMKNGKDPVALIAEVPGMNIKWMEPKDISIDEAIVKIVDHTESKPIHERGIQYIDTARQLHVIPAASSRFELKNLFLIDKGH